MEKAPRGAMMVNFDAINERLEGVESDFTFLVMLVLFSKCKSNNYTWITPKDIAEHIGISEPMVNKEIKTLRKAGIVKPIKGKCMINPDLAYAGDWTLQKRLEYKAIAV